MVPTICSHFLPKEQCFSFLLHQFERKLKNLGSVPNKYHYHNLALTKSLCFYPKYLVGVHILTHQHTSVILRRFFFHFGTVYLYRVVTISVTILPVPKLPNGHCMPPTDGSLQQIFARSFGQLVGGGMDMTGNNMCGLVNFFILYTFIYLQYIHTFVSFQGLQFKTLFSDYLYSGHTCVITSAALFIFEYSPKRWWIYHYLVQIVAIIGVLCILVAHEVTGFSLMKYYFDFKSTIFNSLRKN